MYAASPGAKGASAAKKKPKPVLVGTKTISLQAGQHKVVKVALNAAGRRLLLKLHHRLSVTLKLTQRRAGGTTALLVSRSLLFKAKKHS